MTDDDFDRIQPAQLDLHAAPSAQAVVPNSRTGTQNALTFALLIGLVAIAAGVVFVLPRFVDAPAAPAGVAAQPPGANPAGTPAAAPSGSAAGAPASPWQQAQAERERAAAKAALDALLAAQFDLQERGVENWAPAEFAAALEQARSGDAAYRTAKFAEAEAAYRAGGEQLQHLLAGIDQRLADHLAGGRAALEGGDVAAARERFRLALAIAPGNSEAQGGLVRADAIEKILPLMQQGSALEAASQPDKALASYRAALAIDAGHEPARVAAARVQAQIDGARESAGVSAAYAALAAGRLPEARAKFQAALAVNPKSAAARDGLQQVDFRLSQQRITGLLAEAQAAEAREDWARAQQGYAAMLGVDAALSTASEGKRRADTRLALDAALEHLRDAPEELYAAAELQKAERVLAGARAIADPGPRLQSQIAAAQAVIDRLRTPVAVTLRSDGITDVSIFRIGHIGSFDDKAMDIPPGNYVAVGSRSGYRDVRIDLKVRPGQAARFTVQCTEKI